MVGTKNVACVPVTFDTCTNCAPKIIIVGFGIFCVEKVLVCEVPLLKVIVSLKIAWPYPFAMLSNINWSVFAVSTSTPGLDTNNP